MTLDIQRTIRTLETVFPKARIALPERLTPGWLAQCEIRIRDSDEHGLLKMCSFTGLRFSKSLINSPLAGGSKQTREEPPIVRRTTYGSPTTTY